MVARLTPLVDDLTRMQLAFEADLTDPEMLTGLVTFYGLTAGWLMHLQGGDYMAARTTTTLPLEPTDEYARVPDFVVQDMLDTWLFVARTQPQLLHENLAVDQIVLLLITFLASPSLLNVHQRARVVEILGETTPEHLGDGRSSRFFDHVQSYPAAVEHLGPALMRFYVGEARRSECGGRGEGGFLSERKDKEKGRLWVNVEAKGGKQGKGAEEGGLERRQRRERGEKELVKNVRYCAG